MESRLAQFASLNQKDKVAAYQTLFTELIAREDQSSLAADVHTLVDNVVNQESVGLVISRLILSELVKALSDGKIKATELRKTIVQDTLTIVQPRIVSYEEQVSTQSSILGRLSAHARMPPGQRLEVPTGGYLGRGGGME